MKVTIMNESDEPGLATLIVDGQEIQITQGFNLTELGNAERMVALFEDELRYCKEEREWYTWNGIRWVPDRVGTVAERAKDTVRTIYAEATFVKGRTKEAEFERDAIARWAHNSEAQRQIKAMIEHASTDPKVAVRMTDFDGNKRLINCPNGTIDLDARVFRKHDREDLLTKVTLAPYDPRVEANIFFSTLLRALPVDEAIYCQRLLGSFLEPTTQNKEWLYVYGKPFSMKSSVTQSVYMALGDYATEFDLSLLTKSKHGVASNAARPELIALEGVRIAWTEETPDDFVIDEQMLKGLTSSGIKSARQLYGKQRNIELICSFVVESNGTFSFKIENTDQQEAAMDRTKTMKFVNTVPKSKRDSNKLIMLTHDEAELTAALSWVVQGYFDRLDYGLEEPATIVATSTEFQHEINPLHTFVKEELVFDDGKKDKDDAKAYAEVLTSLSDIYDRFKRTAMPEELDRAKNARSFNNHLKKLLTYYSEKEGIKVTSKKTKTGVEWHNVRLVEDKDAKGDEEENEKAKEAKMTQKSKNDVKSLFGIKSTCTLEYVNTLYQNGHLHHEPHFPRFEVGVTEPIVFSILDSEDGDHIEKKVTQNDAKSDSPVLISKHDTEKLYTLIKNTLQNFLDAKTGPFDAKSEAFVQSLSDLAKKRMPEFIDYDIPGFYDKLLENDKATQAKVADLARGSA